jgi:glutathione peroxidase
MRALAVAAALIPLVVACKKDEASNPTNPTNPTNAANPKAAAPHPEYGPTAKKEQAVNLPAPGTPPPATAAPADFAGIWEVPLKKLDGSPTTLAAYKGKAVLVVNVASECGLTPQYAALEAIQDKYAKQGFTVVGFPCNQFGGQEPGTSEEIATFCSSQYGITFPIMEKIEVNGAAKSPVYAKLTPVADAAGHTGDIRWNFEKFLISADGTKVTRFAPKTAPDDPAVIGAIEAALPKSM